MVREAVLQMRSIADVQRWLDTQCLSEYSLQRLREAVAILRHPKPRQEDVQRLQSSNNWNVSQKRAQKKRPLPEVIEELKRKVLESMVGQTFLGLRGLTLACVFQGILI